MCVCVCARGAGRGNGTIQRRIGYAAWMIRSVDWVLSILMRSRLITDMKGVGWVRGDGFPNMYVSSAFVVRRASKADGMVTYNMQRHIITDSVQALLFVSTRNLPFLSPLDMAAFEINPAL